MSTIAQRIATLPTDKQALLLQRLKQKISQPMTDPKLPYSPLEDRLPLPSDSWIVRYSQNEQTRLRLFCFPYAGGGASVFRSWSDALPQEVEVCGVQFPGRESRLGESAYTRLAPLVQLLADALSPYLDRPFAFYGHSMGALVSFELARQLRRTHDKHPVCLYLAAYRAPQLPNPNSKISHLPPEVFKVVLRAEGIPDMILQNEELMQAMLPTLRADFELCETYEYREEPPLKCPFTIFGGLDDVRVRAADLEAWSLQSSTTCSQFLFSGSHFFLHTAQRLLLAEISRDLKVQLNAPALAV